MHVGELSWVSEPKIRCCGGQILKSLSGFIIITVACVGGVVGIDRDSYFVSLRPNYFIFMGYFKCGGERGGSSEPPEPPLDRPLTTIDEQNNILSVWALIGFFFHSI